eukprot:18984-Heterococcus_DN1.PRE.2
MIYRTSVNRRKTLQNRVAVVAVTVLIQAAGGCAGGSICPYTHDVALVPDGQSAVISMDGRPGQGVRFANCSIEF